jgi:hypothetical protein
MSPKNRSLIQEIGKWEHGETHFIILLPIGIMMCIMISHMIFIAILIPHNVNDECIGDRIAK